MNYEYESEVAFGQQVKEIHTGFSGVVTAVAFYATGCTQVLVQPNGSRGIRADGTPAKAEWFDEGLVEGVESDAPGGPQRNPAPKG